MFLAPSDWLLKLGIISAMHLPALFWISVASFSALLRKIGTIWCWLSTGFTSHRHIFNPALPVLRIPAHPSCFVPLILYGSCPRDLLSPSCYSILCCPPQCYHTVILSLSPEYVSQPVPLPSSYLAANVVDLCCFTHSLVCHSLLPSDPKYP